MIEQALPLLRCPRGCEAALVLEIADLTCSGCGARYPRRGDVIDFVPEFGPSAGRAQRVMENRRVAEIYEDVWRPWFTRLGGSLTYAQEESWLLAQHAGAGAEHVLDLACGSGRYARMFERRLSARLVIAADLSLPMLQVAAARARRESCERIVFLRADAGRLPLRDGSIDALNCFGALHLFPAPMQALDELGRVARAQARFTCLTAGWSSGRMASALQRGFSRAASFRFFSPDELRDALAHAGFVDFVPEQHSSILLFGARRA